MSPELSASHVGSWSSQLCNWWMVPVSLLLLGAASLLTIDLPLSRFSTAHEGCDPLHDPLQSIEPFGSPFGMTVILLAIATSSPRKVSIAMRIGLTGIAGGLSAGIIKLLICRARPHHFDFEHAHIFDSFQGLFPFWSHGGGYQSFPSAHTSTAVAFAVALAQEFPRMRWLCYTLATLVGIQRIEAGQHFASDVLIGGAVGWMIAHLILAAVKSPLPTLALNLDIPLRLADLHDWQLAAADWRESLRPRRCTRVGLPERRE